MDTTGYAQPTAPRFANAAAGNAEQPKASTAIEEIRGRLIGTQEQIGHLVSRLQNIADRASGPVPQAAGAANGQKITPSGTLTEIFSVFDTINQLLNFAHEQASRIERIA